MKQAFLRHPEEFSKGTLALAPVASTGSAQNGIAIDTMGYDSVVISTAINVTGTISAASLVYKIQGADNSAFSSGTIDVVSAVTLDVTTLGTVNPSGVVQLALDTTQTPKRYVRAVDMLTITAAGTGSASGILAAHGRLFGADVLPAA